MPERELVRSPEHGNWPQRMPAPANGANSVDQSSPRLSPNVHCDRTRGIAVPCGWALVETTWPSGAMAELMWTHPCFSPAGVMTMSETLFPAKASQGIQRALWTS